MSAITNTINKPCGVRCLDVKSGEIRGFKILINKGFPRVKGFLPNVWLCKEGHQTDNARQRNKLLSEINMLVADLYSIDKKKRQI